MNPEVTVELRIGTGFEHPATEAFVNEMVEKGEITHCGGVMKPGAIVEIVPDQGDVKVIKIGDMKLDEAIDALRPYINVNA